jgi:hypothetical protein
MNEIFLEKYTDTKLEKKIRPLVQGRGSLRPSKGPVTEASSHPV